MDPISKAKLKLIVSLGQKKFRYQHRLFVVEGEKMVAEALASGWKVEMVVVREDQIDRAVVSEVPSELLFQADSIAYKRITAQQNAEGILAVVHFPEAPHFLRTEHHTDVEAALPAKSFLLEGIQDPGNFGTILRIADWFGFEGVVCSQKTVDVWNSKVLRASMGAIFRIKVWYVHNFEEMIADIAPQVLVADMKGEPLQTAKISSGNHFLLGNEANGVSSEVASIPGLTRVTIPGHGGAESLNVGVAAGIMAYEATR